MNNSQPYGQPKSNVSSNQSQQRMQQPRTLSNVSNLSSPSNVSYMSYSTEPANWKKFLTALVGILAVFFGLIPRSTYCDVSVMKYMCFRHLINVGVFSVLFITVILLSKMLLGKKFEIKSKWYIAIVVLFAVSLALNFLVNKYKEDANELIL